MRPPMKQASRFRSTAKTSRPSLTNWDLVWPPVFKLLCLVSSNWYLTFSLLLSNYDLLFFFPLRFILCLSAKSTPACAHHLLVGKSDCFPVRVLSLHSKVTDSISVIQWSRADTAVKKKYLQSRGKSWLDAVLLTVLKPSQRKLHLHSMHGYLAAQSLFLLTYSIFSTQSRNKPSVESCHKWLCKWCLQGSQE